MPSQVFAFFALLVSAMVSGQATWSQQYIDTLWAQAGTQIAAASPSPSPAPTSTPIAPSWAYVPGSDPTVAPDTPAPVVTAPPDPAPSSSASYDTSASVAAPTPAPDPAQSTPPAGLAYVPIPPVWTPAPGQILPSYSARFTAPNNPFHTTVAQLMQLGAQIQPQAVVNNLIGQGVGGGGLVTTPLNTGLPIYSSSASDPVYTISCTHFIPSGCDAQGKQVHIPAGPIVIQSKFDQHLSISDTAEQVEFDGWECQPPAGGQLTCYWGGWYPFSGKGLADNGSDAIHGGYSVGLSMVTAEDILQGHIAHALAIATSCLSNPTIYPADQENGGSDSVCGQGASSIYPSTSQPHYGSMVHLKWTPTQIASGGYSHGCTIVLNALSEYGAYMSDTSGIWGYAIGTENDGVYSANDPWAALGAINEFGPGARWAQCLQGLTSSDIEIINIPNLGY